jgi:hypothetical protein
MHARVWELHVRPDKVQDFQDILSSVIALAHRKRDTVVFLLWLPKNWNHQM